MFTTLINCNICSDILPYSSRSHSSFLFIRKGSLQLVFFPQLWTVWNNPTWPNDWILMIFLVLSSLHLGKTLAATKQFSLDSWRKALDHYKCIVPVLMDLSTALDCPHLTSLLSVSLLMFILCMLILLCCWWMLVLFYLIIFNCRLYIYFCEYIIVKIRALVILCYLLDNSMENKASESVSI